MKLKTLFFFVFFQLLGFGQHLKLEPYTFISRANDSVLAEKGTFKVLEDRANQNSDSIALSFVRFKSTNPNPGSPIVYLSGGPGGSGSGTAKGNRFPLFMKLREVADVIAFDQRGTGLSHKLPNCPHVAVFEIDKPLSKSVYVERTTENIKKCLKHWQAENINLRAYNTNESAKDLEDLRKVLNTNKISFWGISYGSHLAFEYIRLYEAHIDKMVLASLEGSDETIKLPKNTQDFVFELAKKAESNYGSEVKYPNLNDKIIEVHKRLEDKPVISTYKNRRGKIDTVGISNFELQSAVATFYLKNPKDSKRLPKLYSEMYEGDFSTVASDVVVMKRYVLNGIRPMAFSMDMQSSISEERKKKVEAQIDSTILGSAINFLLYEWMTNLDFERLPNVFRIQKENNVNALLFSGTLDGRTYLSSGKAIAKKFKNGKHIIVENAGHDLYMSSPAIGDMMLRFFKGEHIDNQTIHVDITVFD